jgi:hypothetical protein
MVSSMAFALACGSLSVEVLAALRNASFAESGRFINYPGFRPELEDWLCSMLCARYLRSHTGPPMRLYSSRCDLVTLAAIMMGLPVISLLGRGIRTPTNEFGWRLLRPVWPVASSTTCEAALSLCRLGTFPARLSLVLPHT